MTRRRMTIKKTKRTMMARKGKKMRTMTTRERDSLTSSNLQRGDCEEDAPHIEHNKLQDEEQHCEQIIHLNSIVQVEREDCADTVRLSDVLRLTEALWVAEVDEDAATYIDSIASIVQAEVIGLTRPSLSCSSAQPATRLWLALQPTVGPQYPHSGYGSMFNIMELKHQ